MQDDKPILIFQKFIDKQHKLVIPKIVVEKLGKQFYMEIYKDKIILRPIKEEE